MIKAVIFDWGGVLIDNPSTKLVNYCAAKLNVKVDLFAKEFIKYISYSMKGTMSENDIWTNVCESLNIPPPKSKSLWKDAVIHSFTDKSESYALIERLRKNGYKTGILSDTEKPTVEYFHENNYDKYFDAKVFSCDEGLIKPEKEIYFLALERLGVLPEEAVFIDDKPELIEAAKKLGINGIVYKTHEQVVKELNLLSVNTN